MSSKQIGSFNKDEIARINVSELKGTVIDGDYLIDR